MTGRIFLLGYERIIFKQAGNDNNSLITTFWLFSISTIFLSPLLLFYSWNLHEIMWGAVSTIVYILSFSIYVYVLSNNEVSLVTGTPVWVWNPPKIFLKFIKNLSFLGKPYFVYCTCGGSPGNTQWELYKSRKKKVVFI